MTTSARPRSPWGAPGPDGRDVSFEARAAEWRSAASAWVFSSSASRGPARAVLLALAGSLGADGDAVVGGAELARRAGLASSTTHAALRELKASGEVVWLPGGGRGRANRYRLCGPSLAAGAAVVPNAPGSGGNEEAPGTPAVPNAPPGGDFPVPNAPGAGALGPGNPPGAGAPLGVGVLREKEPPSSPSRDDQGARAPAHGAVLGRRPAEHPRAAELTRRLAAACRPPDHVTPAMLEAASARAVGLLLAHLDWRKVDEVVGYLGTLREPPRGPAYALELVNRWGLGRGWGVPELRLDSRAA